MKIHPELLAITIAGLIHLTLELISEKAAYLFNISAILLFGGYVLFQLGSGQQHWRTWGFRIDNLSLAWRRIMPFTVLSALLLFVTGIALGNVPSLRTVWLTLLLYLAWGTFQQFALQNFVARHIDKLLHRRWQTAAISALIFSIAHAPEARLMALTFLAGLPLTWYYAKTPNLWIIGLVHGILGTLAFYCILGIDPIKLAIELQLIPSGVLPSG